MVLNKAEIVYARAFAAAAVALDRVFHRLYG